MIELYFGDNDYSLTAAVGRSSDEFAATYGVHSVSAYEGGDVTLVELPQLLQGQSLFASARLIVIRGLSANKEVWDIFGDYLETAGEVNLLLVEAKPDKRTRTYKWLQHHAQIREFKLLDERETVSWLQNHAREEGIDLNTELSQFLISYVGLDQWRLHQDIKKLALADKPMSRSLIEDIIEPNPQTSVFELLDAIVAGRRELALEKLMVVRRGEDPYKFIGLLVSQLYALAVCQSASGKTAQGIAKEAGIHPYVVQKTLPIAQRLGARKLRGMVDAVEECDRRIKTTGAEPWTLVEAAVVRLTA